MNPAHAANEEPLDGLLARIALATRRPVHEVRACYEQEHAALSAEARVQAFVPIFAARRTLARLGPAAASD